jgi:hypothetical protein
VKRYFIAVHSAFKEMREGITFIIDTTDDNMLARQGSSYSRPATFRFREYDKTKQLS